MRTGTVGRMGLRWRPGMSITRGFQKRVGFAPARLAPHPLLLGGAFDPVQSYIGAVDRAWYKGDWAGQLPAEMLVMVGGAANRAFNRNIRTRSYAVNAWLTTRLWTPEAELTNALMSARIFHGGAGVDQASATPVIGDAVDLVGAPRADETAPSNLYDCDNGGHMGPFCIPRHGSRPTGTPNPWPPNGRLPGATNIGFYDGHAEPVPLEGLWQLYWHRGYIPTTRPESP